MEYDNMNTDKIKWKTLMMSMDVIYVHANEGKEHGKVEGNTTPETNDCE
jgi:hypothetical protein